MTKPNPYFFGYGSLVNRATHTYPNVSLATAHGWRRAWVQTSNRPFAYLSAVRASGHRIDGLIAEVPNADWIALDEREAAYARILDTSNVTHTRSDTPDISIYAVPETSFAENPETYPILLSYLDVVLHGYLQEFGEKGVHDFFASTDGWQTPILNDRVAPNYPRHQRFTQDQFGFVDRALQEIDAQVITA